MCQNLTHINYQIYKFDQSQFGKKKNQKTRLSLVLNFKKLRVKNSAKNAGLYKNDVK